MLTYNARKQEKTKQKHKLAAYRQVGEKAAKVRRSRNVSHLTGEKQIQLDHDRNSFEAFINVDKKDD